jgi:hypothetical protein
MNKYISPVQCLCGNILKSFELANKTSLGMLSREVNCNGYSPKIIWEVNLSPIKAPYVNLEKKQIYLDDTYLSHLWAFIYSLFVIFEEKVQKKQISQEFKGSISFDTPLTIRAWKLYNWSLSLGHKFSKWDTGLPNPQNYVSEEEKFYGLKVNNLFSTSVAYILYHEFGHIYLGHTSYLLKIFDPQRESKVSVNKQMENDADDFAYHILLQDNENDKEIIGLSIVFVFLSAILLPQSIRSISQNNHPDLDQRIHNTLSRLNFETEEQEYYTWYFACFALNLFFQKHDHKHNIPEMETAKDLFFECLKEIDQIKNMI